MQVKQREYKLIPVKETQFKQTQLKIIQSK